MKKLKIAGIIYDMKLKQDKIIDWINEQEKNSVLDGTIIASDVNNASNEKKCENCNYFHDDKKFINHCSYEYDKIEDCLTKNYKHFKPK